MLRTRTFLFIIMINDLPAVVESHAMLFADQKTAQLI